MLWRWARLPSWSSSPGRMAVGLSSKSVTFAGCCLASGPGNIRNPVSKRNLREAGVSGGCTLLHAVICKRLSLCGQLLQQRRGLPELAVLFVKFQNAVVNVFQADGIGIPHRPAAMSREAVAVDVDDVDVARPQRIVFFQDARAFVYQSVEAAVQNFLARNLPLGDFRFRGPFSYQSGYFRIGDCAPVFVVFVPPSAGLLAESSHFAKAVARERLTDAAFLEMAIFFADAPANVESREVSHSQRAHGHSEIVEHAVDFLDASSFFQQKYRLPHVGMKHAVADEAAAIANKHADFAEFFRKLHGGGDHLFTSVLAANEFQQ